MNKPPSRKAYHTIITPVKYEIESIKASRFVGYLYHVETEEDVSIIINNIKLQHPHAKHCCYAYQLYLGNRQRFNDDGEPSGSAGKPILAPIIGYPLHDVLVVVVRYFGGTKLGVGGLVRAYGQASQACIKNADIITIIPKTKLIITHDYERTDSINKALSKLNLAASNTEYGEKVTVTLEIVDDNLLYSIDTIKEYCFGELDYCIVDIL